VRKASAIVAVLLLAGCPAASVGVAFTDASLDAMREELGNGDTGYDTGEDAGADSADGAAPQPGDADSGVQPCRTNADCPPDIAYCSKARCDDDHGVCELRPATCDSSFAAVCGCDGVVYWNDCLRQQDGIAESTMGECTGKVPYFTCTPAVPCPTAGAICARVSPGMPGMMGRPGMGQCQPSSPGVCWVLPDTCPDGGADWALCDAPHTCTSFCGAVQSGEAYHVGPTCP
jgi:hypothetical protein